MCGRSQAGSARGTKIVSMKTFFALFVMALAAILIPTPVIVRRKSAGVGVTPEAEA